ncbi:MAG: urease accessory protein UreD [Acidimicrobiales bacterium]
MISSTSAVIDLGPGGAPTYVGLRSAAPLLLQPTPEALYLVGSAAGPLGGDQVSLDLRVRPGVALTVRSVAATIARPGPRRSECSHLAISVDLADGASLRWLPEPGVAGEGCRHLVDAEVRLGRGCTLIWREELILGRHGEAPGSWASSLRVDLDGQPLLRQSLDLGASAPGCDGPAIAGDAHAVGSLLIVEPTLAWTSPRPPPVPDPAGRVRVMALAGPGLLVSALASTATGLRQLLTSAAELASDLGTHPNSSRTSKFGDTPSEYTGSYG